MGGHERVLVVDDDRLILAGMAAALEGAGFRVWTTEAAEEALRLARRVRPDAIVTDLRMPEMDGLALLERLERESLSVPQTVIIYSATPPDHAAVPSYAQWIPKTSSHKALIDVLSARRLDASRRP
jgi:CheY-like chemotaxis protein